MRRAGLALLLTALAFSAGANQHANQKKGFNAENVYDVKDIDAINAFNGNLTLSVGIGPAFPISDSLSYGLALHYNANLWDPEVIDDPPAFAPADPSIIGGCDPNDGITIAHPHRRSNAGLGWILTLGRLLDPDHPTSDAWIYESADGAEHQFNERLHDTIGDEPTGADGVMYTRDETYLRMSVSGVNRIVEFPDGSMHTFQPPDGRFDEWMPIRIANRFTANFLSIVYTDDTDPSNPGGVLWTLQDNHGRVTTVTFAAMTWDGDSKLLVRKVDVPAFGTSLTGVVTSKRAVYNFVYSQRTIGRTEWAEKCTGHTANAVIQTLDQVQFPDDPSTTTEGVTKYAFQYKISTNWHNSSGLIEQATLPTGAKIKWLWSTYYKPDESGDSAYLRYSYGVETRELWLAGATSALITTYDDQLDDNYFLEDSSDTDGYPRYLTTKVKDPLQNVTVNYFSASVYNFGIWKAAEYGMPFARKFTADPEPASGPSYLSSVTYPPNVAIDTVHPLTNALTATYVRYEADEVDSFSVDPVFYGNWRVAASRTYHFKEDGTSDYVDTENTDFDNLGHYRSTSVSGSFGSLTKTVKTRFNPARFTGGPFSMLPTGSEWILNTFDKTETIQGNASAEAQYCFDSSNGFLNWQRLRRKIFVNSVAKPEYDLLTVLSDSTSDGMVDSEKFSGGEANPLPGGEFVCGTTVPAVTPTYSISHTASKGVRASSQHVGAPFKSLNLTIDPTGLPSSSKDESGLLETHYVYNPAGQLREVHPPVDDAWTEYLYKVDPAAMPYGTVTVRQWPSTVTSPPSGTPLTEARYYYDSVGRVVQQRTWMGVMSLSAWSVIGTTYDVLGRKKTRSVPIGAASGSWGSASGSFTQWDYDDLGRTKAVFQPDSSATTMVYSGASQVSRTAKIETAEGVESDVVTTETVDPQGRLVAVVEDSGEDGAALLTTYEYDEGDRLTKVSAGVQERTFDYDGAGLLVREKHPESAASTYTYGAAGHVATQTSLNSVIRFAYDTAERPTFVWHDPDGTGTSPERLMKEFTYGPSGYGLGRLATAKRHNYHPDLGGSGDATVLESYAYDTHGRISSKTTTVTIPGSAVRTFTDGYTYDELGAVSNITYPSCPGCGFTPPQRTIENVYKNSFLRSVTGLTSDMLYHPNGMLKSFRRINANGTPGPLTEQTLAANAMARPGSIAVTSYCTGFAITVHPPATKTVTEGTPAGLSVTAPGATSYQWYSGESAISGATAQTLNVPVAQTTSYWVRVGNGTCTVDSIVSVVTVTSACTPPVATISPLSSVKPHATATVSVAEAGTYWWTIQNGTFTTARDQQSVTFEAGCSGTVVLTVELTTSCGTTPTSRNVPVNGPSVTLTATSPIAQGTATTVTASGFGTGSWSVTWSDLATAQDTVNGSAIRTETLNTNKTYSVAAVNGCAGSFGSSPVTVTVIPPAPTSLTAAKNGTAVQLTWTKGASAIIDSYRIERCTASCASGGTWVQAGTATALTWSDTGVTANRAYVYRVRSVRSGTVSTAASPLDFASTFAFTNDPVIAEQTWSLASHLAELRAGVDSLRTAAGLSVVTYTDPATAGTVIKAVHITELRQALNAARTQLGRATQSFTDPVLVAGDSVRAIHVTELRGGMQ